MKKKILILILTLSLILCIFSACAAGKASYDSSPMAPGNDNSAEQPSDENTGSSFGISAAERKIIYNVDLSLYTDNFDNTVSAIKGALKEDEWFDSERKSDGYAYYTARVKTSRLDAFIEDIKKESVKNDINKTATDISLNYQSKEDRIATLNEEKALLNTYAESLDKTPYEFITRIAEINTEIARLNREIEQIDSLIEYSTVNISVIKNYTPEEIAYKERANNTFFGAWTALSDFFKFLGIAIIAIFPFLLVLGPVIAGIILLVLYSKRKKPFDKIPRKNKNIQPKGGKTALTEKIEQEKSENDQQ